MSTVLTQDLLDQFRRAISMLRDTIGKFSPDMFMPSATPCTITAR